MKTIKINSTFTYVGGGWHRGSVKGNYGRIKGYCAFEGNTLSQGITAMGRTTGIVIKCITKEMNENENRKK